MYMLTTQSKFSYLKFKVFALLLLLLTAFAPATAQKQAGALTQVQREELKTAETGLAALAERMYTDSSADVRFESVRNLIKGLVATLKTPNSFSYPFNNLRGVSIQYAPDSTFRIFTMELHVNRDEYRHYGAIQKNSSELQLTPLIDRTFELRQNPETAALTADRWLGASYYNLLEAGVYRGNRYYFLFGFDSYSTYRRRKILEVFYFDAEGKPHFGAPVFLTANAEGQVIPDRHRIILEYGAEGTAALRFDPDLNAIVYENLILTPGSNGEGPVAMPDGSYHSLTKNERGLWRESDRVFTQVLEEAPREVAKPVEGKDIIGRRRN